MLCRGRKLGQPGLEPALRLTGTAGSGEQPDPTWRAAEPGAAWLGSVAAWLASYLEHSDFGSQTNYSDLLKCQED